MSLAHAILGFLNRQPMTGYDLKTAEFDRGIVHFWPADQAQIYRTLDKLAEQGFVVSQIEAQEDRPNRKVYSLTASGREEFLRWLQAHQELPTNREPFLVQLYFANNLTDAQVLELLQNKLQAHQEILTLYKQIEIPPSDDPAEERRRRFQRMTQTSGIYHEQAYINWLADCINQMTG